MKFLNCNIHDNAVGRYRINKNNNNEKNNKEVHSSSEEVLTLESFPPTLSMTTSADWIAPLMKELSADNNNSNNNSAAASIDNKNKNPYGGTGKNNDASSSKDYFDLLPLNPPPLFFRSSSSGFSTMLFDQLYDDDDDSKNNDNNNAASTNQDSFDLPPPLPPPLLAYSSSYLFGGPPLLEFQTSSNNDFNTPPSLLESCNKKPNDFINNDNDNNEDDPFRKELNEFVFQNHDASKVGISQTSRAARSGTSHFPNFTSTESYQKRSMRVDRTCVIVPPDDREDDNISFEDDDGDNFDGEQGRTYNNKYMYNSYNINFNNSDSISTVKLESDSYPSSFDFEAIVPDTAETTRQGTTHCKAIDENKQKAFNLFNTNDENQDEMPPMMMKYKRAKRVSATNDEIVPATTTNDSSIQVLKALTKRQANRLENKKQQKVVKKNRDNCASAKVDKSRFRDYQCSHWEKMLQEASDFVKANGHGFIPHDYEENPSLARWAKRQRWQYKLLMKRKSSTMTEERREALESIGFVWDAHCAAWEKRWNELLQYRDIHGHTNIPTKYPPNQQLAIWAKSQRRHYHLYKRNMPSHITAKRIELLNSVGFRWNAASSGGGSSGSGENHSPTTEPKALPDVDGEVLSI